jgi:hypothetical protein
MKENKFLYINLIIYLLLFFTYVILDKGFNPSWLVLTLLGMFIMIGYSGKYLAFDDNPTYSEKKVEIISEFILKLVGALLILNSIQYFNITRVVLICLGSSFLIISFFLSIKISKTIVDERVEDLFDDKFLLNEAYKEKHKEYRKVIINRFKFMTSGVLGILLVMSIGDIILDFYTNAYKFIFFITGSILLSYYYYNVLYIFPERRMKNFKWLVVSFGGIILTIFTYVYYSSSIVVLVFILLNTPFDNLSRSFVVQQKKELKTLVEKLRVDCTFKTGL